MREVMLLSRLQHMNIVRYYNAWVEDAEEDLGCSSDDSEDQEEETEDPTQTTTSGANMPFAFIDNSAIEFVRDNDEEEEDDEEEDDEEDEDETNSFQDYSDEEKEEESDKKVKTPSVVHNKKLMLYIQMQFCQGASLRDYIEDRTKIRKKEEKWRIFRQILEALQYIHSLGMIHRDLKPSNVFLDKNYNVKLGDYGLATRVKDAGRKESRASVPQSHSKSASLSSVNHTIGVGTQYYIAPEVKTGKYNQSADMYSLGIIFFEMWVYFGSVMERDKVIKALRQQKEFPDKFEKETPDIVPQLILELLKNPNERPTPLQLLQNDSLPMQVEDKQIHELLLTVPSHRIANYIFQHKENSVYSSLTFDFQESQGSTEKQARCKIRLRMKKLKVVRDHLISEMVEEAQMFGFQSTNFSALYPLVKEKLVHFTTESPHLAFLRDENDKNYVVIDKAGLKIQLPEQQVVSFANNFAKQTEINRLKGFSVGKVYRKSKPGFTPNQNFTFLIATALRRSSGQQAGESRDELMAHQAETVAVCCQIFTRVRQHIGNYKVRISHTGLLDYVWSLGQLNPEKKVRFMEQMKRLELVKVADFKKQLKEELKLEPLEIEKLVAFMKCNGKLEDIKEEISRQKCLKFIDTVSPIMKILTHLEEVLSLVQIALGDSQLHSVVLDMSLTHSNYNFHSGLLMTVNAGSQESLFIFQEKKATPGVILAQGGSFDNLIGTFSRFIKSSKNQEGIGVEIDIDALAKLAISNRSFPHRSIASVCIVSQGQMTREKLEMAQQLRQHKVKTFCHMRSYVKQHINKECQENGIRYLVIFKKPLYDKNKKVKIREFEGRYKTKETDKHRDLAIKYILDSLYLC